MPNQQYSADTYIPASAWGKDHWSTLAYVDHLMTECVGFQVGADARMRTGRRNFRVMHEQCPHPKRPQSQASIRSVFSDHGSRLRDGTVVQRHDDWSCIQDMAQEGLFLVGPGDIEPGIVLQFSPKGQVWAHELRIHKQQGGQFATFTADALPAMEECKPADSHRGESESFRWGPFSFDVSAMLADIKSKKLRPSEDYFDESFVEKYATTFLGVDKFKRHEDQKGSFLMRISTKHALGLPEGVLDEPVIVAYAGKGKGYLSLGSTPDYVLCDGNHRMARRFLDELGEQRAYILSEAQSRRYRN